MLTIKSAVCSRGDRLAFCSHFLQFTPTRGAQNHVVSPSEIQKDAVAATQCAST